MKKTPKITRAKAIYGLVLDEKSLLEHLSADSEFAKFLLSNDDRSIQKFIYPKVEDMINLKFAGGEIIEGSKIYILGREVEKMKDDQTLKEFKNEIESCISAVIKTDFSCSIFAIPEGVFWP